VGPTPPPGRSQPIRTTIIDEDDEMEERDDESGDDEDDEGQRKPLFEGLEEEDIAGMLMDLIPEEERDTAFFLIDEFVRRIGKMRTRVEVLEERGPPSKGADLGALQKAITEEVQKAIGVLKEEVQEVKKALIKGSSQVIEPGIRARSWAAVAAEEPPKKVIPGRIGKEVLIRGSVAPAITRRSPQEIVQAINGASEKKGAVAARKLPSGDVVITFQEAKIKEWHTEDANSGWIQKAFGEEAKEAKRTFAVLVKGILKRDLKDMTEAEFGKAIGLTTIERVKFRIPTMGGITRATALVTMTSEEEAKKACDEGVFWRAQILHCEPYWAVLQTTQCYKCWGWGHTQRFCRKSALCPRCGITAHGEGGRAGEAQCPTHDNQVSLRCSNCTGKHPAWVRWCPEAVKARNAAREAYQYRPRTFDLTLLKQQNQKQRQPPEARQVTFQGGDEEYQVVGRKRPRGRPPSMAVAMERAAKDPRQGKLNLAMGDKTGPGVATGAPAATAAADQDVGMQGA
jgi:hypothetical protein